MPSSAIIGDYQHLLTHLTKLSDLKQTTCMLIIRKLFFYTVYANSCCFIKNYFCSPYTPVISTYYNCSVIHNRSDTVEQLNIKIYIEKNITKFKQVSNISALQINVSNHFLLTRRSLIIKHNTLDRSPLNTVQVLLLNLLPNSRL